MSVMHFAGPVLALIFVVLLVFGSGRLARRVVSRPGWPQSSGQADRLGLGPKIAVDNNRRLVILRCDQKEYAVLIGPGGDTLLGEVATPAGNIREVRA